MVAIQEDAKKKVNDVFQIKSKRDVKDVFNRAREALRAISYTTDRNGRYNRLNIDDEETEYIPRKRLSLRVLESFPCVSWLLVKA